MLLLQQIIRTMPGRNRTYKYETGNPTIADRYYSETWKVRETYQPVPNETLGTYASRLGRAVFTAEEDAHAHIKWHTHQSAGECWICVQIQFLGLINSIIQDLAELKANQKLKFINDNQSIRLSINATTSKT